MLVYGLTLNQDVFEEEWVPRIFFIVAEKLISSICLVGSGLNDIFQLKA